MPRPDSDVLPIEARQAAWSTLWRRLLQPIPDDTDLNSDPESDGGAEDEESAA